MEGKEAHDALNGEARNERRRECDGVEKKGVD